MHGAIALKPMRAAAMPPISYRSGPLWFAAFTNPNCEFRAQFGLEREGYRTFIPKLRRWISHARTKKAVERPLLSRYVFFELEPDKHGFDAVHRVNGVEYIIGSAGVPLPMPEGFVSEFIKRQLSGEFDFVSKEPMPIGARVCIMDGQFADIFAVIVGIGKKSGGEVLAQLIESRTRTRLSMMSVRPA
jgi:transcription antitermination factor NusG